MEEIEKNQRRMQLSKTISEKLETVNKMRTELEKKKKTTGNSVDEQIVIAELEYRLVKEEMALLSYQEQHWESAALWDVPPSATTSYLNQKEEMWEVLHSYILSLKERGAVPALHACEYPHQENSILVSSQGDGVFIPKVEWAHHSIELQNGDRLVEVNGQLVVGKDSSEVTRILGCSKGGVCRVVFLRPLSLYQLMKGGCKETSNLRQELTSVVTRLNHKMLENAQLLENNHGLLKENDDLKAQSRKLKLQIVSLQSILLYMLQAMDNKDPLTTSLPPSPISVFDLLRNGSASTEEGVVCLLPKLSKRSIPSLEMSTEEESSKQTTNKSIDLAVSDGS